MLVRAGFLTSDHKPMRAAFGVRLPQTKPGVGVPSGVALTLVVTELKATLNRYKTLDVPDPYIEFFSDPADMLRQEGGKRRRTKHVRCDSHPWLPVSAGPALSSIEFFAC